MVRVCVKETVTDHSVLVKKANLFPSTAVLHGSWKKQGGNQGGQSEFNREKGLERKRERESRAERESPAGDFGVFLNYNVHPIYSHLL